MLLFLTLCFEQAENTAGDNGHESDDLEYYLELQELMEKELGKRPILKKRKGFIELRLCSKSILEQFEQMGIPVGNKSENIAIPNIIKNDLTLTLSFLRGIADTDFSLIFRKRKKAKPWPRITADMKSKRIIYETTFVLNKVGIKVAGPYIRNRLRNNSPYTTYQIDINGHENFFKWMKLIGFRNPKHRKKIGREQNISLFP